jgi:hypothetical protein
VFGQDAGLEQGGVQGDGVMAVREQETVAAFPFRLVDLALGGVLRRSA